jgi:hypothetical protein
LISGGGVTLDTSLNLPSGTSCFQPSLQAQDGSFVGMVYPQNGASPFMADFAQSAKLNWSAVGNFQPQIATADGGVIATNSDTGAAITFDATGKATGQMASLPTQSWTGNAYRMGSTEQLASTPTSHATSYAARSGGNPSATGTYVPSLGAIYRSQIAADAKNYVGNSTTWEEGSGGTTCNLFVRDVLNQASDETQLDIPAPVRPNLSWYQRGYTHPFLAKDWANASVDGGCWKPLPSGPDGALPGDIVATGWPPNGNDGTGHVGIVVEPDASAPNYKDASAADVPPYWWTPGQMVGFVPGTITLTDYGFRLPGFDTTQPSDVQGLKQDSHIRRFSCY